MYIHEISLDSFVLLQAEWSVEKARLLIECLKPTHVIVHRTDLNDYYHLYTKPKALKLLAGAGLEGQTSVYTAFNLREETATPTTSPFANVEQTPDRCVVIDEGHVVGFFDVTVPPEVVLDRGSKDVERGNGDLVSRSLVADFPEQVPLRETASLLVSLSALPGSDADLPLVVPVGTTVDIVIQPQRGFTLIGPGEGSFYLADEEETLPIQFKLKATGLGPGRLRVLAFRQGQPLGAITLAPTVVPATQTLEEERRSHEQHVLSMSTRQPDLSLVILEQESGGKPAFTFRITALDSEFDLNFKQFGPVRLRLDPLRYFQDFFKDIENLPMETAQDKARAERRLAAKGAHLFETVIPEDLQILLWSLRERIQLVRVQSEEPWIPWELCKLQGKENGRVVEGPFFCESFAITRWLLEIGLKPALTLRKVGLVVPRDSALPMAASERDYVLSLANSERQVQRIPATFLDVMDALATGLYDGWHFTGHGGFCEQDPNRSAMILEDQDELTPEALSGVVKNLGLARPLVFLNACQIGRGAMSLTGIGGWAARFLRAGAAAFVGAYWSVYDRPAHDFAEALYSRLLSGMPIGQAAQEARKAIKPLGDPTWLAYTVYADPAATVQLQSAGTRRNST